MAGVSAAGLRGISAVISRVRDLMVMSDVASGRERINKKSVIKEINLRKVHKEKRKAIVEEARRTNLKKDWGWLP